MSSTALEPPYSEQQLVVRLQHADSEARTRLYRESVKVLSAVCRRFLREEEDVRDALHDAYITIFTTVGRFTYSGTGSLAAWMRRIVVNQCITVLRRRKATFVVPIDDLSPTDRAAVDLCDDDASDVGPHDAIAPDVLHTLIASLPDGYRTVLCLFAIEGLSHKEIARMLGISENTSASQYSRAKRLLAQRINQYTLQHS